MQRTISRFAQCLACVLLIAPGTSVLAEEMTLIADAHVDAARPGVNSGAISNLNVGGGYTGLMQFDLGLLPTGTTSAQISRAVLRLYVNRVDVPGVVSLQGVNGGWTEYGVTYATIPALGVVSQGFSVSQAGAYVALDVTALVQGWVALPVSNHGLALTAGAAVAEFDSKENDLTAHAAALDVVIVSQGPAGAAGVAGAAGLPGSAGSQGLQGIAGASGQVGSPGTNGAAGAPGIQGAAGPSGFTYRGTYNSGALYQVSDVVMYQGSSYISLTGANSANVPDTSHLQWGLVASGGTGGAGTVAAAGIAYQGVYSSVTNYGLNDIVLLAGSSYVSLVAGNHGNTPGTSLAPWGLLAQGGSGLSGAPGPAGAPGLVYQGAYGSSTNYGLGDVVLWQGSSYASTLAGNHGNTPSLSPGSWGLLTAQGAPGGVGATGAQGPGGSAGALGPVGSPGERGAQGLQGIPGQAGAQGLTGAQGAAGLSGPMGGAGVAGPAGLAFKGVYASGSNYGLADGVQYGGSGYVSLVSGNHGNTPDQSPGQWALFASAGSPGSPGAAGSVGPIGQLGPQGATGAGGAAGPVGVAGARGPAVANYVGVYASSSNYATADAVSYGGATYVSLVDANHGNTPDASTSSWAVLAGPGPAGVAGPTGPAGSSGPSGGVGATGAQGAPVSFAGGWSSGRAYGVGDAVSYAGASYIATTAQTGRQPDVSPAFWGLLAQAGLTGAPGPVGATGSAGSAGVQGFAGAVGAAGASGPVGLVYQGTYASTSNYALNDAVTYGGSSYISLVPGNRGNAPDQSSAQWSVLGKAGGPGAAGPAGAAGPSGVTGPQGAGGAPGPTGANGSTGISFRGAWTAGTGYTALDAVTFNGSTYLAQSSNSSVAPDTNGSVWAVLAAGGGAGPSGSTGTAASVQIGTVTTGAAGSSASVTNRGSATAAVLDFVLPQGAPGAAGSGGTGGAGGGTSGVPFASVYHAVSFSANFYSVNNGNQNANETGAMLSWVPGGCTATKLTVFSLQAATITVTMRVGMPGAMVDSGLTCQVSAGTTCTGLGSVPVPAGGFVDLNIAHADSNPSGVWSALNCN